MKDSGDEEGIKDGNQEGHHISVWPLGIMEILSAKMGLAQGC